MSYFYFAKIFSGRCSFHGSFLSKARSETRNIDPKMHVHISRLQKCPALHTTHMLMWARLFVIHCDPAIDLDAICVGHRLLAHDAFRRYIIAQGGIAVRKITTVDPSFGTLVRAHGSFVSALPIPIALFELVVVFARSRVGDSLATGT